MDFSSLSWIFSCVSWSTLCSSLMRYFTECNSFRSQLELSATSNKLKLDPYGSQQCGPNNLVLALCDLR